MRGRKWLALLLSLILAAGALPAALAATATDPTGTCDHNWKRTGTTATCYEGGVIVYTCTKCGEIRREQTGPLGHDYGPMETDIPATCTEPGRDVRYCRRDHTHKWYFDVEPLGHDWGEWEVVTQPTAEAEGLERRVCRRDPSHVEERSIPKLSEKDEAPPTADIKLTGILDRYMYYVGEDMTVIYILTNTGDVPLTLVSQEGDAEGVPLPATLAPDEVYQWHVDEKVSAAMFQDGFHDLSQQHPQPFCGGGLRLRPRRGQPLGLLCGGSAHREGRGRSRNALPGAHRDPAGDAQGRL